jgi:hypothetical protein
MSAHATSVARRALAAVVVLTAVSILASGAAFAAAGGHQYPPAFTKQFTIGCVKSAQDTSTKITAAKAQRYCATALACIERKLTIKQVEVVYERMQSGKRNPNAAVLTKCEKSAAAKTIS